MVLRRPSKSYKDFSDVQEDPKFGNPEMTYFSILFFSVSSRAYTTLSPGWSNIPIAKWGLADHTLSPTGSYGNAVRRPVELSNRNHNGNTYKPYDDYPSPTYPVYTRSIPSIYFTYSPRVYILLTPQSHIARHFVHECHLTASSRRS